MVRTVRKKNLTQIALFILDFFSALVLNLLKDILERSKKFFNKFRTSAGLRRFKEVSCVILLLISAMNIAGNDEELFLRGNSYYKQKDYENALNSYDAMSKKGRAVFYNMGNCSFHQKDYAHALLYWSRAENGATPQEYAIIARNKEYVHKILGNEQEQALRYKMVNMFYDILPYISLIFLQILFVLCWYLLIFATRRKYIKTKKLLVSCLCFFIGPLGVLLGMCYTQQNMQQGIIVKKEAQLFVGPDKGLQALAPVKYAHKIAVKEMREGWYKIGYADMIGWVEADVVQVI